MLQCQPANRPCQGTAIVADKGFAGADFEEFLDDLDLTLVRSARRDERVTGIFPDWLRQRVEAIIWTLKSQRRAAGARRWTGCARQAPEASVRPPDRAH